MEDLRGRMKSAPVFTIVIALTFLLITAGLTGQAQATGNRQYSALDTEPGNQCIACHSANDPAWRNPTSGGEASMLRPSVPAQQQAAFKKKSIPPIACSWPSTGCRSPCQPGLIPPRSAGRFKITPRIMPGCSKPRSAVKKPFPVKLCCYATSSGRRTISSVH